MARWGRCDYRELKKLDERLQQLSEVDMDRLCRDAAKKIAQILWNKVKKRTPVGVAPKFDGPKTVKVKGASGKSRTFLTRSGAIREQYWAGYRGGSLRDAWTILPIEKHGDQYTVTVINNLEYASYVEYGHRQTPGRYVPALGKTLKASWVPGKLMAAGLQKMGKSLYAVGNRTYDKAVAFAEKYGIEKVYPSIDEMFADEDVDIIYITTPHNTHYGFMKKALENGKHILVEKSITLNSSELCEMISLANERGLILAEAMTIWHMPIYKELWKIIENGELGKVQMITVNFGSFKDYDMKNRFFNRKLAGGAMLDIGVYALSIVRSFMEEKPENLMSQWKSAPTGVDEQATILLQNDKDQMATVALTMHSKQPKRVMISCEKGYIEIMEFPRADKAIITEALTGEKREISAGNTADALYYELTDMETAINSGDASVMKLQYSIDVMDIMTRLRNEWGLKYPEEE